VTGMTVCSMTASGIEKFGEPGRTRVEAGTRLVQGGEGELGAQKALKEAERQVVRLRAVLQGAPQAGRGQVRDERAAAPTAAGRCLLCRLLGLVLIVRCGAPGLRPCALRQHCERPCTAGTRRLWVMTPSCPTC
jgi:hypothetical protein